MFFLILYAVPSYFDIYSTHESASRWRKTILKDTWPRQATSWSDQEVEGFCLYKKKKWTDNRNQRFSKRNVRRTDFTRVIIVELIAY